MARLPTTSYDPLPRADSNLVRDVQAGLATEAQDPMPSLDLQMTPEMVQSMRSTEAAKRTLLESEVMPDTEFSPGVLQTFGAYFRSENTVGSALSSQSFAETLFPTPESPKLTADAILRRVQQDGLGANQHVFEDVETVAQYEAVKADLRREIEDQRIMAASGTMTSVAAMLASGILDLPTLLPGSVGVRLGARGVSTAQAAGGVAAGAAADAALTESVLQGTQVTRGWEESAAGIGGSIILGGMLGAGLHRMASKSLGSDVMDRVYTRMESTVKDVSLGSPGAKSAGAAAVDAYDQLRRAEIDGLKPTDSVMFKMLEGLGKLPGFVGLNARIPMLDLNSSQSGSALAARAQMLFTPFVTRGEIGYDGPTVMGLVRDYRQTFSEIAGEMQTEFKAAKSAFQDYADFDAQIVKSLLDPMAPAHPSVKKIAERQRKLYDEILDSLIESNVLPPSVRDKYGKSYVPMVFDRDAIRARDTEFKELILDGFRKAFREDAEEAIKTQNLRRTQNAEARERIIGITGKEGVVDKDGNPVINPKTGKQRQRTVVIKEGAELERKRITREQYQIEIERVSENRTNAFKLFDDKTAEVSQVVGKQYDDYANELVKEHARVTDRIVRNADMSDAAKAGLVSRANREHAKRMEELRKERVSALDLVAKQRRNEKKQLAAKYDAETAEAKAIRDENLGNAEALRRKQLKESIQPLREGVDGIQFVRGGKVADDLVDEAARAMTQRWYDKTTGWAKHTLEHELDGFSNFLKKRRTPVPHIELLNRGFVQGRSFGLLEDYVRMAGTDAAIAKVMKTSKRTKDGLVETPDLRLAGVMKDIDEDYDVLRDAIFSSPEFKAKEAAIEKKYAKLVEKSPNEAAKRELYDKAKEELAKAKSEVEVRLGNQRDRDKANLEALLDGIRGTNDAGWGDSATKAAEAVSTLNYVRLMGGTVVSSLTDPLKIAISTGMGNTVKGAVLAYHQMVNKAWRKADANAKGLTHATAAMMEMNLQARLAAMADLQNPMRTGDTSMNMLRKMSDVFSKASGITWWNAFWKQTSENAISAHIGQLSHKGWDNLSKSERKYLGSLRINKDGLDIIRQAHEAQPHSKWFDKWPLLDHRSWDDQEASRLVRHALDEEVNNQVVTPQSYDRMKFASTPGGRLIWQFRQHMVSNQMRFLGRNLQLASQDTHHAAALGTGFVGLVMAGALVDYLKTVTGQLSPFGNIDRNKSATERYMDEWRETPGAALYNALDRSDAIGIAMEGSNILDKLGWAGPKYGMQVAFGDDPAKVKQASRFRNRSVADTLLGPTAGLVNDSLVTAVPTMGKVLTGQKITRGDFRGTERLIPGQNIPYVQYFTNAFERHVGDIYSWPNPK